MSDNTVIDAQREARAWPSVALADFRDQYLLGGMLSAARGDYDIEFIKLVSAEIAAGRLIDAGRISPHLIPEWVIEDTKAALKSGRVLLPSPVLPIVFSSQPASAKLQPQTIFAVIEPAVDGKIDAAISSWAAKRTPNGGIMLAATESLSESSEVRDGMLHLVFTVSMVTRYLSTCKDAVTTATHNGVAFSKLDVEKAIRLKAAEKATVAPAAPTDGGRPLTLGEARRALVEASEPGVRALEGENARGLQRLQDAFREAKEGRLFVVENLPTETVSAREADACAAFRSGDLRPPFPNTFILATISGVQVPYLFGVKENDVTKDGFSHLCIIFSVVRENGRIVWRTLPGGSPDWEKFQICTVVTLSLIVDSRVSVLPIKADDKLNKARVKSGKPAIPPYFFIAPPGPTVLVPGSALKPATAKGGTHASPRPHDRRGHPRNLKSGRTVWVRDCKINALLPHLTRDRTYYEVRL